MASLDRSLINNRNFPVSRFRFSFFTERGRARLLISYSKGGTIRNAGEIEFYRFSRYNNRDGELLPDIWISGSGGGYNRFVVEHERRLYLDR